MVRTIWSFVVSSLLVAFFTFQGAHASALYEQPVLTGFGSGLNSDGVLFQAYDSFILSQNATLTNISWYGLGTGTNFTIGLYANSGTEPNLTPFYSVNVTANRTDVTGQSYDFYSVDYVTPVNLDANTTYWLSIVGTNFGWSQSTASGGAISYRFSDGHFIPQSTSVAYALNPTISAIPLPAALPLFLTMLAGIGGLRWWRRKVV